MKKFLIALLLALTLGAAIAPAQAQLAPPDSRVSKSVEPNELNLQTHGHYRNKAGQDVHSPSRSIDDKVPAGASAKCRDASYSFSRNHRGTCSHHGGVANWL